MVDLFGPAILTAQTAAATAVTGSGSVVAVVLTADTVAAATLQLYDNTSAAGTKIGPIFHAIAGTSKVFHFPNGIPFGTGVHGVPTGANAEWGIQHA